MSLRDINDGAAAWLYSSADVAGRRVFIRGGCEYQDFVALTKASGGKIFEEVSVRPLQWDYTGCAALNVLCFADTDFGRLVIDTDFKWRRVVSGMTIMTTSSPSAESAKSAAQEWYNSHVKGLLL